MLNKQKGNMYGFVTHTWNPIKGKCPHDCSYCYMKRFPQGELRLDEKCLKDNLGERNVIFVGSSTDMWAKKVRDNWIRKVLEICRRYPKNTYLFQSKNPIRFKKFIKFYPINCIFGTTAETNRFIKDTKAPQVFDRLMDIKFMGDVMITIEPIMDFDLDIFVEWIKKNEPRFVNIGADSKGHNLSEPRYWDKIQQLITELKKFTKVNLKDNLKRLEDKK